MDGNRKLRVQPFGKVVFSLEGNVTKRLMEMERFFGTLRLDLNSTLKGGLIMKSHYRPFRLLAVVVTLAATLIWMSWSASQVRAIQDSEEFPPPFGLAQGQTARLTLLNGGETAIVGPEYRFLNSRGDILARSADEITILPGHFRSFDFDLPNPPPGTVDPYGRIQLRAVVSGIGNPDEKNLRISVEVFDNVTGRTSFIIQPPPEPD